MGARGVHITPNGTTILVASILELGHAFHANLTPSTPSSSLKSISSIDRSIDHTTSPRPIRRTLIPQLSENPKNSTSNQPTSTWTPQSPDPEHSKPLKTLPPINPPLPQFLKPLITLGTSKTPKAPPPNKQPLPKFRTLLNPQNFECSRNSRIFDQPTSPLPIVQSPYYPQQLRRLQTLRLQSNNLSTMWWWCSAPNWAPEMNELSKRWKQRIEDTWSLFTKPTHTN